jgi:multicomponent Na+:H+ antiporter subunit D
MRLAQYLIIIPLAAAFVMLLARKRFKSSSDILAVAASLSLTVISFVIALSTASGKAVVNNVGNWPPKIGISLVADGLSSFMLVIANFITLVVSVYSIAYIKKYMDKWKYYSLLMLMAAGVNGVLATSDIFNLFIFMEIASIAVYALVAFGTEREAMEASFKYAVMSTVASSFILMGIAFLYSYTSTLNMADMAIVIASKGPSKVIAFVSVLFLMGFGLKAALVPFHAWLPDAYSSAPATIPAMSSGVLIKSLGVYVIIRIFFNVFGITQEVLNIFITLAVLSMLTGSIMAFGQSNIKRFFGYSSISQIGYIFLGLGIGTPMAIAGSLFHLFNHSAAKSLLFLNAGDIETNFKKTDLNKMSGAAVLARTPVCGYTNLAGMFSICGVPPFAGFWSKLIIILACIQARRPFVAFIAVFVSILTIAYYFRAMTPVLFGEKTGEAAIELKNKPSLTMNLAMIALSLICLFGGVLLLPNNIGNNLLNCARSAIENGCSGYAAILFGAAK